MAIALMLAACAGHKLPPPSTDIDETLYRDSLRQLTSADFAGRRPGTSGEDKTVAFLVQQFRKQGLKPGNGTMYVQSVPLIEMTPAADARLSLTAKAPVPLTAGADVVTFPLQPQPQIALTHSEVVFVGYGIVAPEYMWDDYAGLDVRNKTVVLLAGDPGVGSKEPNIFRGLNMTGFGRWEYKVEEAARHGAAAVVLVHDAHAGLSWPAALAAWSGPQLLPASAAPNPVVAGVWLSAAAAARVFASVGLDLAAEEQAAARPGFKAVPLGIYCDATLTNTVRRFDSSNVIAVMPGSGHGKNEAVLYLAHWDQLGERSGALYPGAVDDASGVAGLVALGQSFVRTDPRPERAIVFLAVTGGVAGHLGAQYYVEHPLFPLRTTAAVITVQGLFGGGHTRDLEIYGFGNTSLEESAREQALLQGRDAHADEDPQRGLYYFADSYLFASHGVPVLYAQGGTDDAGRGPAWGRQQRQAFFAERQDQPADRYAPDENMRGALDDLGLYYEVGNRIARSRRFPRWNSGSEFRASHRRVAAEQGE